MSDRVHKQRRIITWGAMQTDDYSSWILKFSQPTWGGVDFYGIHYKFWNVVNPPEAGWIFMAFIINSEM